MTDTVSQPGIRTTVATSQFDAIRKKALQRLAEKLDPTKVRNKPQSIIRLEARRLLDQFFEVELPTTPRPERDRLAEELLADAMGFGPLDELFRTESIHEVMILAHNQIITRSGEMWLPASVQFRDKDQLRKILGKMIEQGEPIFTEKTPSPLSAAVDVRLNNGFRLVAVMPPGVFELPPVVVLHRLSVKQASTVTPMPVDRSVLKSPVAGQPPTAPPAAVRPNRDSAYDAEVDGPVTGRYANPIDRIKRKVTETLLRRLAEAGKYDVTALPAGDLQRVILLYIEECLRRDQLDLSESEQQRLMLELFVSLTKQGPR